MAHAIDDDDGGDNLSAKAAAKKKGHKDSNDFDCPVCNANNPLDAPLKENMEISCHYCGAEFKVRPGDGGKFKLREQ